MIQARLSLRVWGWDYKPKYTFTGDEPRRYPDNYLQFPEDEVDKIRQLEITFGYYHPEAGQVSESLSCYVGEDGCRLSSQYYMMAYAETGYEGHGGKQLEASDESVSEFLDLVADIVGDVPETVHQRDRRVLSKFVKMTESTQYSAKIQQCIEALWPTQAIYLLMGRRNKLLNDKTIGLAMYDEITDPAVINQLLDDIIQAYQEKPTDALETVAGELGLSIEIK